MKAYERLNVEVVKFEAQDVITASVAECICSEINVHYDDNGRHHGPDESGKEVYCPAKDHIGCPEIC